MVFLLVLSPLEDSFCSYLNNYLIIYFIYEIIALYIWYYVIIKLMDISNIKNQK